MKRSDDQSPGRPTPAARAEAAVWIARLHGPHRTAEVEEGLRRWLAEDGERAAAFELLTDLWEQAAQLRRGRVEEVPHWRQRGVRLSFARAAAAALAVGLFAALGTVFLLRDSGYSSGIGEQRTLALPDGSRIYLNTDSQARVHYSRGARQVALLRGEALFEVAKRPDWPFIVSAAGREVRALGTAFDVRADRDKVAVTLVEGKVSVQPSRHTISRLSLRETPLAGATYTLRPGERLTFIGARPPQLDHPALEAVTAWRQGQVVLNDTPLAEAASEMNRYSSVPLLIQDPQLALIRVSGVFALGDSEDFAAALAHTYQLSLRHERNGIVLSGHEIAPNVTPGGAPQ